MIAHQKLAERTVYRTLLYLDGNAIDLGEAGEPIPRGVETHGIPDDNTEGAVDKSHEGHEIEGSEVTTIVELLSQCTCDLETHSWDVADS
jgi:hypothetical protein